MATGLAMMGLEWQPMHERRVQRFFLFCRCEGKMSSSRVEIGVLSFVLLLGFVLVLGLVGFALASPAPGPAGAGDSRGGGEGNFEITADVTEYDGTLGVAKATGHVVVVYKTFTLTADSVEYREADGSVVARGNARLQDSSGEKPYIIAPELTFFSKDERVLATSGVTLVQGNARLYGDRLEALLGKQEATAEGKVRMVYDKIAANGDHAVFSGQEKRVVISGNARVENEGRVFLGGKITVYLEARRVVGSEGTKLIIPAPEKAK